MSAAWRMLMVGVVMMLGMIVERMLLLSMIMMMVLL